MSLTDGAAEVLAHINRSARPYDQLTIAEARESLRALSARYSDVPEQVGSVEDHAVPGGEGMVPVRVYRPAPSPSAGALPIVVMLHGGGWALGDFDTHDWFSRALCNAAQAVVVAVEYRRTPEHAYPAALDDTMAAIEWAADEAARWSAQDAPLFVLGDSAGGNLAAAAAIAARDRGGPAISGQILIYPVLDARLETPSCVEFREGYFLTLEKLAWYWRMYAPDPAIHAEPLVSPLRNARMAGLPPALVLTAACDPLRDEGELYSERLRAAGVEASAHRYEGLIHAFTLMSTAIPEARDAVERCASFLRRWSAPRIAQSDDIQHHQE